jgi:hypothetical protein
MGIEQKVRELQQKKTNERVEESRYDSDSTPLPSETGSSPSHLYGKFDEEQKDNFGDRIAAYFKGDVIPRSERTTDAIERISKIQTPRLKEFLSQIEPSFGDKKKGRRILFYLINLELSKRGVAPRWRGMIKPVPDRKGDWDEDKSRYLRDMQVMDMQWLHSHYPGHRVVSSYDGIFKKLQASSDFDYSQAHMIAAAEFTSSKKAEIFKLTKDMQAEMSVLKDRKIENRQIRVLKRSEEVETDLVLAANRNPRRGKKLLKVIQDKKALWLSAMMTDSNSESVMIDNYKKLTGMSINRSTFRTKFNSLNDALKEVGSKYAF